MLPLTAVRAPPILPDTDFEDRLRARLKDVSADVLTAFLGTTSAEEVAKIAPQLVVFDKDGAPQTVRYHFVNAMLLNEVQKQRQLVEEQQGTILRQQSQMQNLAARLAKLEALLQTAQ